MSVRKCWTVTNIFLNNSCFEFAVCHDRDAVIARRLEIVVDTCGKLFDLERDTAETQGSVILLKTAVEAVMASDDTSPGLSSKPQSPEKPKGVSRKKKSASQTEVLERAYALEKYPSETTRSGLSRELNLSEKQLQIWFTHRRYKDRRDGVDDEKLMGNSRRSKYDSNAEKQGPFKKGDIVDLNSREGNDSEDGYPARVLAEEHYDDYLIADHRNNLDVGDGGHEEVVKTKPKSAPRRRTGSRISRDPSMCALKSGPRPNMITQAQAEQVVILAVEGQLGGRLRNDGPPLGFEFDPLPPFAFQRLTMTEVPSVAGGSREDESENSDRDGMEGRFKRSHDLALMEKKKMKMSPLRKRSRGDDEI